VALGSGLALAELVAGVIRDAPSPVVAVGQTVIDAAPPALKDWAISTFGTANKLVLVTGTIVILVLVASAAGSWPRVTVAARPPPWPGSSVCSACCGDVGVTRPSARRSGTWHPPCSARP
jgi:hypothetical protein